MYGLARRKGEPNPWKWGLEFDSKFLGHKALEGSHELPPRDREGYGEWKKKVFGEGKGMKGEEGKEKGKDGKEKDRDKDGKGKDKGGKEKEKKKK